tara:strand:- start:18 stop:701 length:684 start_codon:yes stop_codon:yes gene_type:complete
LINKEKKIITIDGPTCSGKGTISRLLAKRLGWSLLDSGALYRALAFLAKSNKISPDDIDRLSLKAKELQIKFVLDTDNECILLDNNDVTNEIRQQDCGIFASKISQYKEVRDALYSIQRSFICSQGLVADGRDMGTIVFPEAQIKIFLEANTEVRAVRRHKQLKEKGINVSLPDLSREISERDFSDINRKISPLRPAEGAYCLDSTKLNIDQTLEEIISFINNEFYR